MATYEKMKRNLADHFRSCNPGVEENIIDKAAHRAAMDMVLYDRQREKELLSVEKNCVQQS